MACLSVPVKLANGPVQKGPEEQDLDLRPRNEGSQQGALPACRGLAVTLSPTVGQGTYIQPQNTFRKCRCGAEWVPPTLSRGLMWGGNAHRADPSRAPAPAAILPACQQPACKKPQKTQHKCSEQMTAKSQLCQFKNRDSEHAMKNQSGSPRLPHGAGHHL